MKRIIRCLLGIMLLCSLVPVHCFAVDEETAVPNQDLAAAAVTEQIVPVADSSAAVSSPLDSTSRASGSQELPDPAAQQPPASPSTRYGVMISYLQTTGSQGASDEIIELSNNGDSDVDITGWCLKRASSGEGKTVTTVGCMTPMDVTERILLPGHATVLFGSKINADTTFAAGMAEIGGAALVVDATGVTVDALAWGNNTLYAESSRPAPATKADTALQRRAYTGGLLVDTDDNAADVQLVSLRTTFSYGAVRQVIDVCANIPGYQAQVPDGMVRSDAGDCNDAPAINVCAGIQLSEIGANMDQQFIEVYNSSDEAVDVTGCRLVTNRSSQHYAFDNLWIQPHEYYAVPVAGTDLTLTKTTTGTVYIVSSDGAIETNSVTYANLAVDTSWAIVDDVWQQTYLPTFGAGNQRAQYAACEQGYERNNDTGRCNKIAAAVAPAECADNQYRSEETGRCRAVAVTSVLAPCKDGQYRSEETNRCRSIATAAMSIMKPCADDQFRNPSSGRCKKIASSDDVALADCGEGRERNPETNRCRNVLAKTIPPAAFAVEPMAQSGKAFVGWWALGGMSALAIGYGIWQWRRELVVGWRRIIAIGAAHK